MDGSDCRDILPEIAPCRGCGQPTTGRYCVPCAKRLSPQGWDNLAREKRAEIKRLLRCRIPAAKIQRDMDCSYRMIKTAALELRGQDGCFFSASSGRLVTHDEITVIRAMLWDGRSVDDIAQVAGLSRKDVIRVRTYLRMRLEDQAERERRAVREDNNKRRRRRKAGEGTQYAVHQG